MASMNEAYDLDLFRPRQARLVALDSNPKAQKQAKKHSHRQKVVNLVVYLTVAVMAMAMIGYLITCNVRLNEINKSILDSQATLNTLQSERVRMEAELASKTSAEQIEKYALENGMLPVESSQIYYVTVETDDLVTLPETEQNWLQQAWNAICRLWS